jgi:predicted anti-sigma-YlaC factor YlaD
MESITHDVIADLWPLYVAGEASPDTRALIEAFLSEDRDYAQTLAELSRERITSLEPPPLTPDHELKTLARIRRRLAGPLMMLQLALVFTCFTFGTLIADTSFDVSPRRFIATALVALCFWAAFLVRLFKNRREVLVRIHR